MHNEFLLSSPILASPRLVSPRMESLKIFAEHVAKCSKEHLHRSAIIATRTRAPHTSTHEEEKEQTTAFVGERHQTAHCLGGDADADADDDGNDSPTTTTCPEMVVQMPFTPRRSVSFISRFRLDDQCPCCYNRTVYINGTYTMSGREEEVLVEKYEGGRTRYVCDIDEPVVYIRIQPYDDDRQETSLIFFHLQCLPFDEEGRFDYRAISTAKHTAKAADPDNQL